MSCCNCGPTTIKVYPNAPAVCPDTPEYVFSNANLSGEGVFFDHTGTAVQFYGIASSGGTIDVTLDAPNNTINIEIDDAIVAGNFPDSTTVVKGKTAYSTNAEALAKASTTKAVTPSNFAAMGASTTFAGFVELATEAETQAGVSTTLAVTPAGLSSVSTGLLVTRVAANAVTRGAMTPAATGQLLMQTDTGALYKASSTTIGDWDLAAVPLTGVAVVTGLTLGASGELEFGASATRTTMPWEFEGGVSFIEGDVDFVTTGTTRLLENGVVVPASSVLMTSSTAGQFDSALVSTFLSDFNTTVYDPTSYTPLRALNGASPLVDVAAALCTLMADLSINIKPSPGS